MRTGKRINRREILKYAMGTCPAVCGFPSIVRASALGKNGSTAPSNRVNVGCIGNGAMGTYDIRGLTTQDAAHVAAVCDVSKERRIKAQTMLAKDYGNKDCKAYNDFREVLARDDIDAVSIAAQDHWHALITVAAAKAGKDVYCQKPLGMTMEECQVVREVVRKEGIIFQTGTQQRSSLFFRLACELARNGYIGKVHTVEVATPGPKYKRTYMNPPTEEPIPDGFDFERYVGPAKMRPYNRGLHTQPDWYLIRDYCVGFIVNWGVHHLDIANWGVPEITSGQCEVEFSGSYRDDGLTDNINDWRGEFRYPSGLKMAFSDVGNPCAKGTKFIGDEGWVYIDRGMFRAEPISLLKTELKAEDERLYPGIHKNTSNYRNFIDCVLSRKEPLCPVEGGAQASYLGMVAEISVKLGRKLTWDHEKERFVDDAAANALLGTPMRGTVESFLNLEWTLPEQVTRSMNMKRLIVLILIACSFVSAGAQANNLDPYSFMTKTGREKPEDERLRVVLLADEKDHGPAGNGLHDYPLWQRKWARLLGGEAASEEKQVNLVGPPDKDRDTGEGMPNVAVSTAWHWPSEEQFQTADVIVAYCYLEWTDERLAQVRRYLEDGGGLVLIHSATWTRPKPLRDGVAEVIGVGGFELFRHGDVRLEMVAPEHPICAGLPETIVLANDETYWPPTPIMESVTVLATSVEDKAKRGSTPRAAQPMFWCYELGEGRVFGCVPGHSAQTFDNSVFRKLLFRGIAWTAGESSFGAGANGAREESTEEAKMPAATDLQSHGVTKNQIDSLADIMRQAVEKEEIAGSSFLVSHQGEIIFREAFGYADIESKRPFTTDELLPIASVSKPFMASVIMVLVDQGKLNLDDPVEKYLPEFKGKRVEGSQSPARPMTIRHLLSHTAGFWGNKKISPEKLDLIRNFERPLAKAVKLIAEYDLLYEPGTKFTYSGTGYCVAGRVAEVALGQSLEEIAQEALFRPLGLNNTTFLPSKEKRNTVPTGYLRKGEKLQRQPSMAQIEELRFILPGGSLFTTLDELAVFGQMHLNNGVYKGKRILSEASVTEMRRLQSPDRPKRTYGFGWFRDDISESGLADLLSHSGALGARLRVDRSREVVCVFLVHQSSAQTVEQPNKLFELVDEMFPVPNGR